MRLRGDDHLGMPPVTSQQRIRRWSRIGPVQVSTVEASVQPAGSILVEMTNYAFKPATLRNPSVSILNVVALSAEVQPGHSAVFTIDNQH
jgi:hypothetical protein